MKPAWIKCSDKMPEKWERILLYSPYEKKAVIGALTNNGWGLDTTYISDHGHSGYLGGRVISSFTNWMPLPSPPDIVNET
jgi:hypothetical protein